MRGDGIFDQEYRIVRDDGTVRWIRARGRASGPERLLGASVDVTDRVEAERRAAGEAERVMAAADAAELGFSDWTVGGGPPYIDARLRELFDLNPGDVENVQELWLSRVHPDDRAVLVEQRRQLISGDIGTSRGGVSLPAPQSRVDLGPPHLAAAARSAGGE